MEARMKTIGIIGAGRMGAAIAYLLLQKGKKVKIWDRSAEILKAIQAKQESPHLLGVKLENISVEFQMEEAIKDTDLIVLAIPSFAIREICQKIKNTPFPPPPTLLISKGMEEKTSLLPFEVIEEVLGKVPFLHITGVGYAQEINKEIPVKEVLVSKDELLLKQVKNLFETKWLCIETTDDVVGVQIAGALKNVMVIGIGLIETLQREKGNKKDIREKLIAQGIREMKKIGTAIGAKKETFEGPAGRGDLELSADPRSRNYTLGKRLAKEGQKEIKQELKEKGITVEGFHTAIAMIMLSKKHHIELPLVETVHTALTLKKYNFETRQRLSKLLNDIQKRS